MNSSSVSNSFCLSLISILYGVWQIVLLFVALDALSQPVSQEKLTVSSDTVAQANHRPP